MAVFVLMGLFVAGLAAWLTPGLPRWLKRTGLVVHVLVTAYIAMVLIHAWRMIRP